MALVVSRKAQDVTALLGNSKVACEKAQFMLKQNCSYYNHKKSYASGM
jgi:hypothetical protein